MHRDSQSGGLFVAGASPGAGPVLFAQLIVALFGLVDHFQAVWGEQVAKPWPDPAVCSESGRVVHLDQAAIARTDSAEEHQGRVLVK